MKWNKTTLEKYELYKRLMSRWKTLPKNVLQELVDRYEIDEQTLNKVRSIELNKRLKELNERRNTKPDGLQQSIHI